MCLRVDHLYVAERHREALIDIGMRHTDIRDVEWRWEGDNRGAHL